MKCAIMVLSLLLTSSVGLSQSTEPLPKWKFVAQINNDRIEFKCIEGCAWRLIAVGCAEFDECRWTLDQNGLMAHAEPFDFDSELEKGREEYQRRLQELLRRQP